MSDNNFHTTNEESAAYEFPSIYFSNALKQIIQKMVGLELYEVKYDSEENGKQAGMITGVITLIGVRNIMISLSMPVESAYIIVAYMTGNKRSDLKEDEMYDGVSELANMMSGQIKAQFAAKGNHFNSVYPFTIVGEKYYIIQKNHVENFIKKFKAGSLDILMEVFFI